jgi:hypothetical protein
MSQMEAIKYTEYAHLNIPLDDPKSRKSILIVIKDIPLQTRDAPGDKSNLRKLSRTITGPYMIAQQICGPFQPETA